MYRITLKEGREKLPLKHHPWVFSNAVEEVKPEYNEPGWAEVSAHDKRFIAYGWYDEKSGTILRLMSWNKHDKPGDGLIKSLVKDSVIRRRDLLEIPDTNAIRLIHGDADMIPGLTADCYGRKIRLIVSSRFAYDNLPVIAKELFDMLEPSLIEALTDRYYGPLEGIPERTRVFVDGAETKYTKKEKGTVFKESGIYYEIPPGRGQKSGFYLDQRDNRNIVESYCKGRNVLDLFSYTGAFTIHALRGGALSVVSVDSSSDVLSHLLYQIHLNETEGTIPDSSKNRVKTVSADAFEFIRGAERNKYDLIILDPPKLARSKSGLENAERAYKDLNMNAIMRIRRNGIIATFSCSAALSRDEFKKVLSWAASDAGREIHILRTLSAGEDHPIRASFPESEYLKGFIIRVI